VRSLVAVLLAAAVCGEALAEETETIRAVRHLAPQLGKATSRRLAKIIDREAGRRHVDPLLAVAFVHVESSWNPRLRSHTNDFGLAQVHVAARGSERFLGREAELYDPQTNLREWARLADMWRSYCRREGHVGHPWWHHLKFGYRVRDHHRERKVDRVYFYLTRTFRPTPEV
jgi:hypothetical protein